jgi:hypothetical protein
MDMELILNYILVGGVAFFLGAKLASAWNRMVFRNLLEDLGVTDQQLMKVAEEQGHNVPDADAAPEIEEIEIKIEQCQGQLYAFRLDNDHFLGQGPDRDSLLKRIAEDLSDVKLIIREENGAELLKGKV